MNLEESSEGSSCNGQENGDGYNGSERPLKKARFAWQVKGKYHLKNENNDAAKVSNKESTAPDVAGPSGSGSNTNNSNNIGKQDIKPLNGYLLDKNVNTLDSVVDKPDKSVPKQSTRDYSSVDPVCNILTPSAAGAEEILNITRNIKSQDNTESGPSSNYMLPTPSDDLESVPISMVAPENNYTEDQCIARWQARQMAKGPLDNTINCVLDYMKQSTLEEENATQEALDVADFVNNHPGVNSIENEGILMAISAHGLQNTSNSSASSFNSFSSHMSYLEEICEPRLRSPAPSYDGSSPLSDYESHEQSQSDFEYGLDNVQWSYPDDLKNEDSEKIPSPTFHGTTSLTFQNLYENLDNTDAASNDVALIENHNHHDFLDAAVSFAIQSKGLTTFGTDYG